MRKNNIYYLIVTVLMVCFSGCEEYLNIPPEAALYEEDVFRSYANFQGFQDEILELTVDYNRHGARRTMSLGGECVSKDGQSVIHANLGKYSESSGGLMRSQSVFFDHTEGSDNEESRCGIYTSMWEALRIANTCLEKLETDLLTDATDEQRNWLKGQALFYRAFWHYEYVRIWGTIPYIDLVIPADNQSEYMKRHWSYEKNGKTYNDCQAVLERIAEDMEAAAGLLPAVWPSLNINYGRPTKLAALGYKAKALQYSASPLFNEQSTGNLSYDNDLLTRCAQACQVTIDAAKSVIGQQPEGMPVVNDDGLTKWENIREMYCTFSGYIQPGSEEVLFKKPTNMYGNISVRQTAARVYGSKDFSNQDGAVATCQYVDKFEMTDGTRYKPEYDKIPEKRWEGRDARFDLNFYVHADVVSNITLNLCNSRRALPINSYLIRKYLPDGANKDNTGRTCYATPLLRLADIYLTYAEAAYESTGSYTSIPPGCSMTAEQAVNVVRSRAGQPDVAATLPSYENTILPYSEETEADEPFRLLYRNERAVEMSFEGQYWFDLRRWKRAHLKDGSPLEVLAFDLVGESTDVNDPIDNETVIRVPAPANGAYTFKDPHYWMPFRDDLTYFSYDWEQNPGW
ncbi:RagB/SusD family nutrient uptake outer membrane protein [Bacteroidota bacterium]